MLITVGAIEMPSIVLSINYYRLRFKTYPLILPQRDFFHRTFIRYYTSTLSLNLIDHFPSYQSK